MKIFNPPAYNDYSCNYSVFLAGSIEMGEIPDWRIDFCKEFEDWAVAFFNPYRTDFDKSLLQEQSSDDFNMQVNWEINNLEQCDIILMNFVEGTKSPISLLEFGLYAESGKMIVCCPKGFWRRGNIEIMCTRYKIPLFDNIKDAQGALKTKLRMMIS